jgi:hypothetical protein
MIHVINQSRICITSPCSLELVSACFGLFQLILSHGTLFNQPKSVGFLTSRTGAISMIKNDACDMINENNVINT